MSESSSVEGNPGNGLRRSNSVMVHVPNPFSPFSTASDEDPASAAQMEALTFSFHENDPLIVSMRMSGITTPTPQHYQSESSRGGFDDKENRGTASPTVRSPPQYRSPSFSASPSMHSRSDNGHGDELISPRAQAVKSPTPTDSPRCASEAPTTDHVHKTTSLEGAKAVNEYIILEELGRGAFGKVKLGYSAILQQFFAVKVYNRNTLKQMALVRGRGVLAVKNEIEAMKRLQHPNIIRLHEVIDDSTYHKLYLVLEFAQHGSLMRLDSQGRVVADDFGASCIPSAELCHITRSLLAALVYAHEHGVAHRDVKPENILLTAEGEVKLGDFGVSSLCAAVDDHHGEHVSVSMSDGEVEGTLQYLPPEALESDRPRYDLFKADVWALGVTVYVMAMGVLPYTAADRMSIQDEQLRRPDPLPMPKDRALADFIAACLDPVSSTRPSAMDLTKHSWIAAPVADDIVLARTPPLFPLEHTPQSFGITATNSSLSAPSLNLNGSATMRDATEEEKKDFGTPQVVGTRNSSFRDMLDNSMDRKALTLNFS